MADDPNRASSMGSTRRYRGRGKKKGFMGDTKKPSRPRKVNVTRRGQPLSSPRGVRVKPAVSPTAASSGARALPSGGSFDPRVNKVSPPKKIGAPQPKAKVVPIGKLPPGGINPGSSGTMTTRAPSGLPLPPGLAKKQLGLRSARTLAPGRKRS